MTARRRFRQDPEREAVREQGVLSERNGLASDASVMPSQLGRLPSREAPDRPLAILRRHGAEPRHPGTNRPLARTRRWLGMPSAIGRRQNEDAGIAAEPAGGKNVFSSGRSR